MSYTMRRIDELESIHHGTVKLAGAERGIRSFGMQVLDFPGGFSDYPEHDHAEDGQEEVYVVLRGQADFVIDGEDVTISQGEMIKVDAASRRFSSSSPPVRRIQRSPPRCTFRSAPSRTMSRRSWRSSAPRRDWPRSSRRAAAGCCRKMGRSASQDRQGSRCAVRAGPPRCQHPPTKEAA